MTAPVLSLGSLCTGYGGLAARSELAKERHRKRDRKATGRATHPRHTDNR
ncbi:hypothetical protein [Actinomadura sp. KC216]|nr:hypothetical protein [Actinomadura sp. KC216]